ncbi:MAG: hypothetical protein U0R17_01270 [Acidimicrobiia bacterium]
MSAVGLAEIPVEAYQRPSRINLAGEVVSIAHALPDAIASRLQKICEKKPRFANMTTPTVALPGVGSPGWMLDPLVQELKGVGLDAFTWGDKINFGPTRWVYPWMEKFLGEVHAQSGHQINGVGHSLGGLYHLYWMRHHPEWYKLVASIASPCELTLEEAHTLTNIGAAFTIMDRAKFLYHYEAMEHWERERDLDPIGIPRVSIIATRDGVVPSESCELPAQEQCWNYYIDDTHTGVVVNPLTHDLIGHILNKGPEAKIPLHIARQLRSRDDIVEFEKKTHEPIDVLHGVGNVVSLAAARAARSASNVPVISGIGHVPALVTGLVR